MSNGSGVKRGSPTITVKLPVSLPLAKELNQQFKVEEAAKLSGTSKQEAKEAWKAAKEDSTN